MQLVPIKISKIHVELGFWMAHQITVAQLRAQRIAFAQALKPTDHGQARMRKRIPLARLPDQQRHTLILLKALRVVGKAGGQHERRTNNIRANTHTADNWIPGLRLKHGEGSKSNRSDQLSGKSARFIGGLTNWIYLLFHTNLTYPVLTLLRFFIVVYLH